MYRIETYSTLGRLLSVSDKMYTLENVAITIAWLKIKHSTLTFKSVKA